MIRQILVGVAVAALGLGTVSCGGEIPSCDEVACDNPAGAMEFDGILRPAPQAFAPAVAKPDETEGGAARG
jgi:hypothetical protein